MSLNIVCSLKIAVFLELHSQQTVYLSEQIMFPKVLKSINIILLYLNMKVILLENMLRYFVLGHYLFHKDHSFPQVLLLQNCLFIRTYYVHGQLLQHIFIPNGGYCLDVCYNVILYQKRYGQVWTYSVTMHSELT